MSRNSSEKLLGIVNKENPDDIFLHLVTIDWPDGSVDRYVKDNVDTTSRGNNYQAAAFNIQVPEEPEDSTPKLTFQFSLADRVIINKLRTATEPPILTLEIVLGSDPNIVEMGPFTFDLRKYQNQGVSVSVEAGFEPILDFAVPQITYSPTYFPGLFKAVSAANFPPQ